MSIAQEFRDFVSSVISFPADYLSGWYGYGPSEAGVEVNELTAMQVAAFHGCVRLISGAMACTPLNVYEKTPDGEKIAVDHPLQTVLSQQPNTDVSSADLRQTAQSHLLTTGNGYMEVGYNGAGQPAALYLRNPFQTRPYRAGKDEALKLGIKPGDLFYKTHDAGFERIIRAPDMVHVKNLGNDGLVGLSPVRLYAKEVFGNDIAAQAFSNRFFKNDSRPGGYLSNPAPMTDDRKKGAVSSWIAAHTGRGQNSVAVLDGGMAWNKVGVNPDEAQFIQTRALNTKQIGTMFGVPLHFLGESETSRANMEQRSIEFLIFTMASWYTKWEQALNMRLFPSVGRNAGRFFCRFDTKQFERATYADLLRGIQMGRYAGLYTVNEGRALLGEQPYSAKQLKSDDPGDKLWQPVNMVVVTEDSISGELPATVGGGAGQGGDDQSGGDGGGKPPTGTPQGGKRSRERRKDSEIRYYFGLYKPLFREALGKLLARKKPDSRDFERLFSPVLVSIASAFSFTPDAPPDEMALNEETTQFISGYIGALAQRSAEWTAENVDLITVEEMRRALLAMREKCARRNDDEEPPEGHPEEEEEEDDHRHITVNVAPAEIHFSPQITMEQKPVNKTITRVRKDDGTMDYEIAESSAKTVNAKRQPDGSIALTESE